MFVGIALGALTIGFIFVFLMAVGAYNRINKLEQAQQKLSKEMSQALMSLITINQKFLDSVKELRVQVDELRERERFIN